MNTKFNKFPSIKVTKGNHSCSVGWDSICNKLSEIIKLRDKTILVFETYHGVDDKEIIDAISVGLSPDLFINVKDLMLTENKIRELTYPDVTDDEIFGFMTSLNLEQFFDNSKVAKVLTEIENFDSGLIVIYGCGAAFIQKSWDILLYADMARWEIQKRFRRDEISNIGIDNMFDDFAEQYKRAYFVDWRVCDKEKRKLFEKIDYLLDTNESDNPKMISGKAHLDGLKEAATRPFSLMPFFDPGPWGGQWMKDVCGLDKNEDNFAWCFNCVPEENSLLLEFSGTTVEIPSINLVFYQPIELLGDKVYARFGAEFPIRFDFLDTMDGGNLSLQVHPLTKYINDNFGVHYTQDESYYLMDAKPGAEVYLGLREDVNSEEMINELKEAQTGKNIFNAEKHVQTWPAKKHDHFLIPAGTIHCSGANSMVLEISATPYIFTFKLWDWGRLGLDGKPRPINIEHGKNVIQWNRTTEWVKNELVNQAEKIDEGDGWWEERTGLHQLEFIETRRHWFTKMVTHNTNGGVNVLTLVEGKEIIVESPTNNFEPFVVHYAETFILPAAVGVYTIRPFGESEGIECATIKAYVRC